MLKNEYMRQKHCAHNKLKIPLQWNNRELLVHKRRKKKKSNEFYTASLTYNILVKEAP